MYEEPGEREEVGEEETIEVGEPRQALGEPRLGFSAVRLVQGEQALQFLRRNSKISADTEGPQHEGGGMRARAPPARMSHKMPPRHQMSVECQRLRCLWCSPFIFWVVFFSH